MKKFLFSLVCVSQIFAQDINLGEIKVQATMSELSQDMQSKSISLISSDVVQKSVGTGDIGSVLSNAPSIEYSRAGGINGQIAMRGINSNFTRNIFTIDGARYYGRSTLELNLIDPNSLEMVEIIRGAGSSMYGSSGMNGVVNFRTRRFKGDINQPFDLDFRLRSLEASSVNKHFGSRFEAVGGGNGWDILAGFNQRAGSDMKTPEGKVKNSSYKHYGIDFNVGYTNDDTRYYAQGRFNEATTKRGGGQGSSGGSAANIFMKEDPMYEYYIRSGVETKTSWANKIDTYLYFREFDTDIYNDRRNTKAKNYVHQMVKNSRFFGGASNFTSRVGNHEIGYGIDFLYQTWRQIKAHNLTANMVVKPNRPWSMLDIGIYAKDDYLLNENLVLNGGLRYDYILSHIGKTRGSNEAKIPGTSAALDKADSIKDSQITGSLGAVYFLNDIFSVSADISHNFKAATPLQMMEMTPAGNINDSTIPNTNLKNETSQTYELSFRYNDNTNYASITAFRTNYNDMITLVNTKPKQNQNIGKAYVQGIELQVNANFDDFKADLVASLLDTKDKTNDKYLSFVAPLSVKIGLSYDTKFANFGFKERIYGAKKHIDETQERKTGGFAMSDIYADIKLGSFIDNAKDMFLTVGIDNIFDKKGVNPTTYEDLSYPRSITNPLLEPGRNFYAKFRYEY